MMSILYITKGIPKWMIDGFVVSDQRAAASSSSSNNDGRDDDIDDDKEDGNDEEPYTPSIVPLDSLGYESIYKAYFYSTC